MFNVNKIMVFGLILILGIFSICFSFSQPTNIENITPSGSIGSCGIDIRNVHFTREIGIGIRLTKPVHVKVEVYFDNSSGKDLVLEYTAYIYDEEGKSYEVDMGMPAGNLGPRKWSGHIGAGESKSLYFIAWNGPFLDVGKKVYFIVKLFDKDQNLWLKSNESVIKAKPVHRKDISTEDEISDDL